MGLSHALVIPKTFFREKKPDVKNRVESFLVQSNFSKDENGKFIENIDTPSFRKYHFESIEFYEWSDNVYVTGPGPKPMLTCPMCKTDVFDRIELVIDQTRKDDQVNCPQCNQQLDPNDFLPDEVNELRTEMVFSDFALRLNNLYDEVDEQFLSVLSEIFDAPIKVLYGG